MMMMTMVVVDYRQATRPHGVCQLLCPLLSKAATGGREGAGLCLDHMWPYKDVPNQLEIN